MKTKDVKQVAALFAIVVFIAAAPGEGHAGGEFTGEVVATLLPDGRNLRLVEDFGYIDPAGEKWHVPSGTKTDGASVPQAFWIAFPPFTGKYRQAAVVHDRYCQTKERSWRATHKVFYDAMKTAGVDETTAKLLYGAVYYMGPRWGFGAQLRGPGAVALKSNDQQLDFMRRLEDWIERENPSPREMEAVLETGSIP